MEIHHFWEVLYMICTRNIAICSTFGGSAVLKHMSDQVFIGTWFQDIEVWNVNGITWDSETGWHGVSKSGKTSWTSGKEVCWPGPKVKHIWHTWHIFGDFHKRAVPHNGWLNGKSYENGWFGGTRNQGNLPMSHGWVMRDSLRKPTRTGDGLCKIHSSVAASKPSCIRLVRSLKEDSPSG